MAVTNVSYVRQQMEGPKPAPSSQVGAIHWLRTNLFASVADSIMTILGLALLAYTLPGLIQWLFLDAAWTGADRTACATVSQGGVLPDGQSGACWAFVSAKFNQFIFGRYPSDLYWRPLLVMILFIALLIPMLMPKARSRAGMRWRSSSSCRLSPSSCSAVALACSRWKPSCGAA